MCKALHRYSRKTAANGQKQHRTIAAETQRRNCAVLPRERKRGPDAHPVKKGNVHAPPVFGGDFPCFPVMPPSLLRRRHPGRKSCSLGNQNSSHLLRARAGGARDPVIANLSALCISEPLIQSAETVSGRIFGQSGHRKRRNIVCTRKGYAASVSRLVPPARGLAPRSLVQPDSLNAPPGRGNTNKIVLGTTKKRSSRVPPTG